LSRGITTEMFFRLCSRAPRTEIVLAATDGAFGEVFFAAAIKGRLVIGY